ncbi:SDR family NAD(P)-dependent oxidoreductase [Streptomyces mirabilis]|uniref:SDR family NAD(P)-dependent oxidoreductase n=1 Tax=Streptomyces mirabilis TaxID=68239 RepID=UPI0036EC9704
MNRDTRSRAVLITGGASGLGAALASRYAGRGDRVLVTDLAAEAEVPAGALYQRLDITSPSHWAAARERVRVDLGGLDVLVNNAGIAAGGRVDHLDDTHWRRLLEVNVLGAVNGCRTFSPLLKAQGQGHVVNVASLAGLVHPAGMGSYDASKAAVVALSESLRHELGPWGVDVTVVCPSFFRTNLASSLGGEDPLMGQIAAKLISRAPLGAEEIAARVLRGVDARRFLILPDRSARVAYWTKRLVRPLYDRQMLASGAKIRQAELNEKARSRHEQPQRPRRRPCHGGQFGPG